MEGHGIRTLKFVCVQNDTWENSVNQKTQQVNVNLWFQHGISRNPKNFILEYYTHSKYNYNSICCLDVCDCCGKNDGCGGGLQEGDGDCDSDSDCTGELLCGSDNCGRYRNSEGSPHDSYYEWDLTDDCCYKGNCSNYRKL